jgi:colanic acid/amylovoran biosynthesis glycosyltransferase
MKKINLAYLAPEIPALSATFVYNEILQLEELGFSVLPFSVHRPDVVAKDKKLNALTSRVVYLYANSKFTLVLENLRYAAKHPLRYLKTLCMLFSDARKVGFLSHTALGLVFRFFYSVILAQNLIQKQIQHLHVHFAHIPADIAMYAAALSDISFSVTAHANDLFERGWLLPEKVERATFFATISDYNREFLQLQGCDIDRVVVVRCGVDVEQFQSRKKSDSSDVPKIGFIGRLVEKKGAEDLLFAAYELKKQGIGFNLLLAGSGPLEGHLKALAVKLDLSDQDVSFLGAIAHTDVADFLKQLDVFVLPCVKDVNGDMDGIPVVLMEAMLCGVAVISTQLSGIPELVIDNETGLLVEPHDRIELAQAIQTIISNKTLAQQLNLKAIAKVKKEFNLQDNVLQLSKLFKKAIA